MTENRKHNYFVCDGGPHLLLPRSVRNHWGGMGGNYDPLDPTTDYGRACKVEPPFGLIQVGESHALVLADSPAMSAWGPALPEGTINLFIFEEWKTTDLDALTDHALAAIPAENMLDTGVRWNLTEEGLSLMFAGDQPGNAAYGEMQIPTVPGIYWVFNARYDSEQGKLWIIRLEPRLGKSPLSNM
jgi:hypothetical protein